MSTYSCQENGIPCWLSLSWGGITFSEYLVILWGTKMNKEMGSTAVSCSCVLVIYCYVKAQNFRDENNTSFALDSVTCVRFGWNSSFLLHLASAVVAWRLGYIIAFTLTYSQHPAVNARGPFLAAGGFSLFRTEKGLSSKDKCLSNQAKVISPFMPHFGCFLQWKHVAKVRPCKWNLISFLMGGEARSIVHHTVYYLIKPFKQPCEVGSILYLLWVRIQVHLRPLKTLCQVKTSQHQRTNSIWIPLQWST